MSKCFNNLIYLTSGCFEWKNAHKYERSCWLNRGKGLKHLPYAPTSLEMFMPKAGWSKETAARLSKFVTQTVSSDYGHQVALDWAFDKGVFSDSTTNKQLI